LATVPNIQAKSRKIGPGLTRTGGAQSMCERRDGALAGNFCSTTSPSLGFDPGDPS